jgi:hypothetical protein
MRLLQPLQYQHVYIPVMPISLADYLEVNPAAQLSQLLAEHKGPCTCKLQSRCSSSARQ